MGEEKPHRLLGFNCLWRRIEVCLWQLYILDRSLLRIKPPTLLDIEYYTTLAVCFTSARA